MARAPKPKPEYERLLRQQLRPAEVLDGIFSVGPAFTVAITSERLLIVGPSTPNGWELKSIPWRLFREMVPEALDEAAAVDEQVVRLRYTQPSKVGTRRIPPRNSDPESSVGEEPEPMPHNELILALPKDGGRIAALLRAHISGTQPP